MSGRPTGEDPTPRRSAVREAGEDWTHHELVVVWTGRDGRPRVMDRPVTVAQMMEREAGDD